MSDVIIDVREKDEFEKEHIKGSINIPLTMFNHLAPGILAQLQTKPISIMCLSGKRAMLAKTQADKLGLDFSAGVNVYEGGISAWKKAGHPVESLKQAGLPLMRQTHLAAGSLAFIGTILGVFVNSKFLIIPGFVGAGLAFAGATGFCGMSILLSQMPWNKN